MAGFEGGLGLQRSHTLQGAQSPNHMHTSHLQHGSKRAGQQPVSPRSLDVEASASVSPCGLGACSGHRNTQCRLWASRPDTWG